MPRESITDIQRRRQKRYPLDRICFRSDEESARADRMIFKQYFSGEIDIETCCEMVAKNNCIDFVTPHQLDLFWRGTGWIMTFGNGENEWTVNRG